MPGKVEKVFIVLICASFLLLAVPVGATEYNPGVQVGYWVKYGNFVARGPSDPENFKTTALMKMEVIRVVGNRVTVHTSRTLKNGTFQDGSDFVFDIATNQTDRSANSTNLWNNYLITAGNLTEGNDTYLILMIPDGMNFRSVAMSINKTETKDLLGTNRTVNLVDYSNSTYYYDYRFYATYDQTTGVLLELNYSLTSQISPAANEEFSYFATEIGTEPESSDNSLVYTVVIAVVIVAIVMIMAIALVVRQRRKAHVVGSMRKVGKKNTRK